MATTAKDVSQGKEKSRSSPSAPQNTDSPRARTPKSLTANSCSDNNLAVLREKSTPHYLKHTVSSAKDVCKYGKKQASDDTNLRYSSSRRKSTEPSPPPPSSMLKRTLSASSRGRTPLKPSSSLTKNVVSTNKPVLDKTSKTERSGKAQPVLTRPASIKKGTISSTTTASNKETKSRTSHANKIPSKPNIAEKQAIQSELDNVDKVISVHEIGDDPIKIESEEGIQDETQPTHDQIEPESKSAEDEKSNACDSSILSDKQKLVSNPTIEEEEKEIDEVPENDNQLQEDDEQGNANEEGSNNNENCVNEYNEEGKPESKFKVETKEEEDIAIEKPRIQAEKTVPKDDGNVGNSSPRKLNFRKGKELEKKEEDGGNQRLKFKERAEEDMEGNGDAKPEQENVVLKRQDVQGKKESPAYNDVIEETASKLAEKRKSKVKALVGAFETVISLENDNQQTEDS